jgi:DNA-binding protein Fis
MKKKRVTKNLSNSSLSAIVKKEAKTFIKNMNGNGSTSNMHSLFLNDTERTLIDTVLIYAKVMLQSLLNFLE